MKKIFLALGVSSLAALHFSCKEKSEQKTFLELANRDTTIKPVDDFYLYVNGGWIKKTTIPASESRIGAFLDLDNKAKDNLKKLLAELSTNKHATGSVEQQVNDFYSSGMDTTTIEKLGYEPLKPYLAKIDALTNSADVMKYIAEMKTEFNGALFSNFIGADEKNSSMNIPCYYQGGLGLPEKDYYFNNDANTKKVVEAYKACTKKLFTLIGIDEATATKNVEEVFNLEKQMANAHSSNVELRDPQTNYHKLSVKDLDKQMPNFGWMNLLAATKIKADSINVGQPKHFSNIDNLLKTTPINVWKVYLKANILNENASALSSAFVNTRFDYTGKALQGAKELKPRWERMINNIDGNLGEAMGQLYVEKYFNADAKKRMLSLINNLQIAYENRVNKLDWMSADTKVKAKEKLHTFLKKIGFPNTWKDYSAVKIDKNAYFNNIIACQKNEYNYQLKKVGNKVDKNEWGMSPPTVNAYYNPTFNEIVFPAGILQFPFFDPNADDAINYGGIGMVIGHEMTHGFDDQGAQYDKEGNMINWWTKDDETKFKAKGKSVIDLYSSLTVLDTVHVNGNLTLGENIADIGGIAIAYEAFKMTEQGKGNTMMDGYTPDQRFFMSYGQIWKSKSKDETTMQRIKTDPHSPPIHRVNAPLMNFEPFYKAFNVKAGDKMYVAPENRITIW